MSNTPNMNLAINVVGTTTNPTWAENITSNFATLDSHDHSSNKGVQITPAGINISEDLVCNDHNLTDVRSTIFQNQSAVLADATDINSAYFVGGDFYVNNASKVPIQITSGSGLNFASLGAIGGDYGQSGVTAAVAYNDTVGFKQYTFFSSSGVYGAILTGPITITNVAGTQGVTIDSPASLAAAYTVTLPTALPAAQSILTLDNTGQGDFIGYSSSNTANAVVQRDASGGFTAGAITSTSTIAATAGITAASLSTTGAITTGSSIGAASLTSSGYVKATSYVTALGGFSSNTTGSDAVKITSTSGSIGAFATIGLTVSPATQIYGVCGQVSAGGDWDAIGTTSSSPVYYDTSAASNVVTLKSSRNGSQNFYLTIFYK